MKTSMIGKYATIALFSVSFIALNNCGSRSDSTAETNSTDENGSASDFAILTAPPAGYIVPTAVPLELPLTTVETACVDGWDNDGNGLVDCQDPSCAIHPECSEWGPPLRDIINGRALTVYPNGLILPEDVALLKARGSIDDPYLAWLNNDFFATNQKDCWINPRFQDPYYNIPLGEALVAGPEGPIGPQLAPGQAVAFFGPRAGLVNECEWGTDLMFHHLDDDNGAGAGAGGDVDDEDGGDSDDH